MDIQFVGNEVVGVVRYPQVCMDANGLIGIGWA